MLPTTFITKLTDVETTDKEGVGKIRYQGGKWYKWVNLKNTTATVAAAAGTIVAYFALTGYPTHRVVVDLSDADNPPAAAGITLAAVTGTLGVDYYCWIQIKGQATLDTAVTNGTAGAPIALTTTDKTAIRANEADSAAVYKIVLGRSYNTTTGVTLDCPF